MFVLFLYKTSFLQETGIILRQEKKVFGRRRARGAGIRGGELGLVIANSPCYHIFRDSSGRLSPGEREHEPYKCGSQEKGPRHFFPSVAVVENL